MVVWVKSPTGDYNYRLSTPESDAIKVSLYKAFFREASKKGLKPSCPDYWTECVRYVEFHYQIEEQKILQEKNKHLLKKKSLYQRGLSGILNNIPFVRKNRRKQDYQPFSLLF